MKYRFAPEKILAVLKKKNITRYTGAKMCGLDPSSFYQYISGAAAPSSTTLCSMAKGLGRAPGYFFVKLEDK